MLHGDGAVGKLPGMGIDDGSAVGIAVTVFHQNLTTVDGIPKASPGADFFKGLELLVIEYSGGTPHVGNNVIIGVATGLADLLQLFLNIRGDVGDIVRSLTKIAVDRNEEVFLQHSFDDVFRGAYKVEIFLSALNLSEHDFVDIEYLVDDADIFACLLFVPGRKFGEDFFVNVICPVVYFQYTAALLTGTGTGDKEKNAEEEGYVFLHCL
ncbi:hypothetical protein BACCELL_05005 [Bacteroides cellulosilyticus DSM 14838]|uniref:Uncharacterized protein n=1 Tax=Bacteroides cellulosilyticus DSM 14838 TaxID=537012 RepID=E2NL11_9BACE|nr:hypothetical protein BACCELL_05005 [Bacteroides cellulosilyticus DSM 14838]